jgi:hypothetical protein
MSPLDETVYLFGILSREGTTVAKVGQQAGG